MLRVRLWGEKEREHWVEVHVQGCFLSAQSMNELGF